MLQKRIVPPCEKIPIEGIDPISVFLLGNPKYPLLSVLINKTSGGGRNERELSSTHIPQENSLAKLKSYSDIYTVMDVKLMLFIK